MRKLRRGKQQKPQIRYHRGTKALCRFCGDTLFVFRMDVYQGELMKTDQIYPNQGQAPWAEGERLICRNCDKPIAEKNITFMRPLQGGEIR